MKKFKIDKKKILKGSSILGAAGITTTAITVPISQEAKIQEKNHEINKIEKKIVIKIEEKDSLLEEKDSLLEEKDSLLEEKDSKINFLEGIENKKIKLENELDEIYKKLFSKDYKNLNTYISSAKSKITRMRSELRRYIIEYPELNEKYNEIIQEIKNKDSTIDELKVEKQNLQTQMDEALDDALDELEMEQLAYDELEKAANEEIERLGASLDLKKLEIDNLNEEQQKDFETNSKEFKKLQKEKAEALEALKELQEQTAIKFGEWLRKEKKQLKYWDELEKGYKESIDTLEKKLDVALTKPNTSLIAKRYELLKKIDKFEDDLIDLVYTKKQKKEFTLAFIRLKKLLDKKDLQGLEKIENELNRIDDLLEKGKEYSASTFIQTITKNYGKLGKRLLNVRKLVESKKNYFTLEAFKELQKETADTQIGEVVLEIEKSKDALKNQISTYSKRLENYFRYKKDFDSKYTHFENGYINKPGLEKTQGWQDGFAQRQKDLKAGLYAPILGFDDSKHRDFVYDLAYATSQKEANPFLKQFAPYANGRRQGKADFGKTTWNPKDIYKWNQT